VGARGGHLGLVGAAALAALAALAACAAGPRPARTAPRGGGGSAAADSRTALDRSDAHWWTLEATVVRYDLPTATPRLHPAAVVAPYAARAAYDATLFAAPPPLPPRNPPIILLPSCGGAVRGLRPLRIERLLEARIAAQARSCFEKPAPGALTTLDLRFAPSGAFLEAFTDDARGRCIAETVRDLAIDADTPQAPLWVAVRVRAIARTDADDAPGAEHIRAEIAALAPIAAAEGPDRDRAALLLGTRQADAAFATRAAETPGPGFDDARATFAALLARPGIDARVRRSARGRAAALASLTMPYAPGLASLRAFLCPARFGDAETSPPLPQDHSSAYWSAWETLHGRPIDQDPDGAKHAPTFAGADAPKAWADETVYRSPYAECGGGPSAPEAPDPWAAEAWYAVGRDHESHDLAGGPFALLRAETAYRAALAHAAGVWPLEGFARLALGRVLYVRGRFAEATRELVQALAANERAGGVAAPELRDRAAQLAASALTYVDFDGPRPMDPAIERPDVIDTEPDPRVAIAKIAVALERVQSAAIVPQDRAFTADIVFWLAYELRMLDASGRAAADAYALFLKRWPLHRDAPLAQAEQARVYELASLQWRSTSPEHAAFTERAKEARAKLAAYGEGSAWAAAHKDDPEALTRAERLRRAFLSGSVPH
jgi:hypothetical protein